MLTETEKKTASLAVSRFGVDRARIKQVFRSLAQSRHAGGSLDLLEILVRQSILTTAQARELRLALDRTNPDINNPTAAPPVDRDAIEVVYPGAVFEPRTVGDLRILRPLGQGGMGVVYLAYDDKRKSQFALKVLADNLAGNQGYIDRFYREARSGAVLDHPNIVRTIAVGQDPLLKCHYLVLEYVDGPSTQLLLDRFGRLSVGDAVHVTLNVARGLEHAHSRNVVHRDIKPDNILLTTSGEAKLADLGLSKRTDEATHLTGARQGFGTPYYMPYEQAMSARFADGRCDIFALGATLYHLVTGEVPFAGDSHLEILEKKDLGEYKPASLLNPEIPAELDWILERMLARDPDDRYQTASELIVDLERSGLSAAVPSFVDMDLALQDPIVRARLTAPAQPTRPDLDSPPAETTSPLKGAELWYLRYRNRDGRWCKSRATTEEILRRLQAGRYSPHLQISRQPKGEYCELASIEEFATAVALVRKRKAKTNGSRMKPPVLRPTTPPALPVAASWSLGTRLLSALGAAGVLLTAALVYYLVGA